MQRNAENTCGNRMCKRNFKKCQIVWAPALKDMTSYDECYSVSKGWMQNRLSFFLIQESDKENKTGFYLSWNVGAQMQKKKTDYGMFAVLKGF